MERAEDPAHQVVDYYQIDRRDVVTEPIEDATRWRGVKEAHW